MDDFHLFRESPKDLNIKRFDGLHESSAYFRHGSRCCDSHSAAEGEPQFTHVTRLMTWSIGLNDAAAVASGKTSRKQPNRLGVRPLDEGLGLKEQTAFVGFKDAVASCSTS